MTGSDPVIGRLVARYPDLEPVMPELGRMLFLLADCFRAGGKLLVCGNGGSAADSDHIAGELMKGFMSKRPLSSEDAERFVSLFPEDGAFLADHLQGALPAISLASAPALTSAYANDVAADMVYAQQVFGYGRPGDVLLGISTSGSSPNVIRALQTAKVRGLKTIGLTGRDGGRMPGICDVTVKVPRDLTPDIQELHLPVYHAVCLWLEKEFFG